MTNKVKTFYIRITDDMTPQMVQDAFDKCVDAGVAPDECVAGTNKKHKYQDSYGAGFNYLGTSLFGGTYLADDCRSYGEDAQEITLDQLDEWLGLEAEQEWKNGDECVKGGEKYIYIAKHPLRDSSSICVNLESGLTHALFTSELSKPETPEQKAERERMEDGKSLFELAQKLWTEVQSDYEVYSYNSPMVCDNTKELYARLAEKVGYSKQKTDRNQLEVAYDLYIAGQEYLAVKKQQSFQQFTSDKVQVKFWLAVADKAGYRKQ